jgi:outer membrane biosynthesis protein TonB
MALRTSWCPVWLLVACLPLAAGCTHAQAKTTAEMPALDMPEPPPRDVQATEVEPPPPVPLATEPARNAPARPRPPAPVARPEPARAEPPKPAEQPPVEVPKVADEPPKPPPTLQTTPAIAEGEVERNVRASLQRATNDLNRIDYRALNTDARTQYDQAKRFLRQADEAIRTKNLVFARTIAEKAATIAAQLAGR